MNRQLKGIALILFGILLMIVAVIDPWIPVIGDVGRALLPVLAFAAGIVGLALCFAKKKDR